MFDFSELAQVAANLQATKRNLVRLVGRFYDLLWFLALITIKFKILFQKLCHKKLYRDRMICLYCGRIWWPILVKGDQSQSPEATTLLMRLY